MAYRRAASLEEALAAKSANPAAVWLAGGTMILAGDARDKPESLIDVGAALPASLEWIGMEGEADQKELSLGAGISFQALVEALLRLAPETAANQLPAALKDACLSMANRTTRNRATIGGNLGADKSCSSLIPLLLALDANLEVQSPGHPQPRSLPLESWMEARRKGGGTGNPHGEDLIVRVRITLSERPFAAYRRWNRVACDLSVLGAACAFAVEGEAIRELRIVMGGFDAQARRFPDIESLMEGMPLAAAFNGRHEIEGMISPLLPAIDDVRASAAFKKLRGAQLVAEALQAAAQSATSNIGSEGAKP